MAVPSAHPRNRHFAVWPPGLPHSLDLPATSVYANLAASAGRQPDKTALIYYGAEISYAALSSSVEALAGYLSHELGVKRRDRVLLYMQNCPQFIIAYYAILRVDAVIVPVNPMSRTEELRHIARDTGADVAIVAQELVPFAAPLLGEGALTAVIAAAYSDYLPEACDLALPSVLTEPPHAFDDARCIAWTQALASGLTAPPNRAGAEDWCILPYSSGTTGAPKGCLHSHRSVNATLIASVFWNSFDGHSVVLGTLPMFHVTGMQSSMNAPIYAGATIVVMTRWDRRLAAHFIEHYRVTHWRSITTMAVDFVSDPDVASTDFSSLVAIGGGGAQMPEAVAEKLRDLIGLDYVEGYGLTETVAPTHINPPQRIKRQCLGIPIFDVDARIIDPDSLAELRPGEVGEIVVSGPQVFLGYWNDPEATAAAFLEIDGKRFLRTGDLGTTDEEGYFFLVDRLKRMINASGYKVWPAEVESLMYGHPDILEVCVLASPDPHRGETVKALVVPRPGASPSPDALQAWCRARMAAYKVPRIIEFAEALPRSGSGKVLWRELQEAEMKQVTGSPAAGE